MCPVWRLGLCSREDHGSRQGETFILCLFWNQHQLQKRKQYSQTSAQTPIWCLPGLPSCRHVLLLARDFTCCHDNSDTRSPGISCVPGNVDYGRILRTEWVHPKHHHHLTHGWNYLDAEAHAGCLVQPLLMRTQIQLFLWLKKLCNSWRRSWTPGLWQIYSRWSNVAHTHWRKQSHWVSEKLLTWREQRFVSSSKHGSGLFPVSDRMWIHTKADLQQVMSLSRELSMCSLMLRCWRLPS